LIITINRPESRNAVNLALSQGLAKAVDELDSDKELSAAVLTGSGGNFCAGMVAHTPFFNNYRPQFYFRTTDVTGMVTLPEGT